jgi:hypothetical protein
MEIDEDHMDRSKLAHTFKDERLSMSYYFGCTGGALNGGILVSKQYEYVRVVWWMIQTVDKE